MILSVRVNPRSSKARVKEENGSYKVNVTRPAEDGQANAQLIELLSEHLKVKAYQIKIIKGDKSRNKLIEVNI